MKNKINSLKFFQDKDILSTEEIKTQHGGNDLFRVVVKNGDYLVRKAGRGEGDASMEFHIAELAASIGIAPHVYCFDTRLSIFVTDWINGDHKDTLGVDELMELVRLLKKLHSLKVSGDDMPAVDLRSIVKYKEGIGEAFDICDKYPPHKALCHNDPNPQNIIWSENGVKLIDYEYAGLNDIYFDLAGVSVEFGLSEVGDRVLLEEYWGDDNYLLDKFHACKAIYDALRRQWMEDHTP